MDQIIDFLKQFNIQTILSMAVIIWYFSRDIKSDINDLRAELRTDINVQAARSDKLYEAFYEQIATINRRADKLNEIIIELLKSNNRKF